MSHGKTSRALYGGLLRRRLLMESHPRRVSSSLLWSQQQQLLTIQRINQYSRSFATKVADNNHHQEESSSTLSTSTLSSSTLSTLSTSTTTLTTDNNNSSNTINNNNNNTINNTSLIQAYQDLSKFRLSSLVVSTAAAGYVAAGPSALFTADLAACLVGTALCSSSAAALNQIYERDRDAAMKRTAQRPLVTGALSVPHAAAAAAVWAVTGTSVLACYTNETAALLGAGNIALYAGLYTYLKPRSVANTWVGAVVGAVPPCMGYAAATGGALDGTAALLATLLYTWQMPHFFALAYMYRTDYARGGFQMVSVVDPAWAGRLIVRYTVYLAALPWIATGLGYTSSMFALEGVVLNAYAFKVARDFSRQPTNGAARKVFLTSLWYLPCWLMLYLLHAKDLQEQDGLDNSLNHDDNNNNNNNELSLDPTLQRLQEMVLAVRQKGRELCVHERVVMEQQQQSKDNNNENNNNDSNNHQTTPACPVTLTKRTSAAVVEQTASVALSQQQQQQQSS